MGSRDQLRQRLFHDPSPVGRRKQRKLKERFLDLFVRLFRFEKTSIAVG